MLGGTLSHPVDKASWLNFGLLRRYPFFLPGGVASVLSLLAICVGFFIMHETLPSKAQKTSPSTGSDQHVPVLDKPLSVKELLANPALYALCVSGFALSFLNSGFQVTFALFAYTSVLNGGLGLSTEQIGYSLTMSGAIFLLLQLMIMPYLVRTFNKAKMYNFCFWMFPIIFPLLAALNVIAREGYNAATGKLDPLALTALWIGIAIVLAMSRFAGLAFGPKHIGSSIFAASVDYNILGGFAWVIAMSFAALVGVTQSISVVRADLRRR
ncbi:hypothetical protein HWV62_12947 [Athelia sp. TMB]|nr:hypothetical protein HWV62_12947 [Athelia sp. TMB]